MLPRAHVQILGLLICLLAGRADAAQAELSRVRCLDSQAKRVLYEALRVSPTVRQLAARLEDSDVITYLRIAPLTGELAGTTRLLSAAAGNRFVVVTLGSKAGPLDLIPRLGHELRHVVEIAEAPDVKDEAGMRALFQRIGWGSRRTDNWETREAIEAGRRVTQEMWERPTHTGDLARAR